MKLLQKLIFLFLIFIFLNPSDLFSQSGWQQVANFNNVALYKVYFINENTGFSVGSQDHSYSMIYKTTNGGSYWSSMNLPGGFNSCELYSITFINNSTGFIVGGIWSSGNPIFMKTTDQGVSWSNQTSSIPSSSMLWDVKFSNEFTGYICGSQGLFLKTTNGGNNWNQLNTGTSNFLKNIQIAPDNPQIIYAIGVSSFLLKSTNAGINWEIFNFSSEENITNLSFINNQTGYVSGALYSYPYSTVLYKTTDGGYNWSDLTTHIPAGNQTSVIKFYNINTGYLAGNFIHKTTNGGINWTRQESYPWWTIYKDIFILNNTFISVICTWQSIYNGIILKTVNGGDSPPNPPSNLSATRRLNVNKLIWVDNSVIENGYIAERNIPPDTSWFKIDTINSNQTIYFDTVDANNTSYRIYGFNDVGNSIPSNIAVPTLISINQNSNYISSDFELFQNYPNPFNPSTRIKFSLSQNGFVNIEIYDYLGKIVSNLFSGELNSGYYNLSFDGSNLASGIYFCKLTTKNYSKTKKMILVR